METGTVVTVRSRHELEPYGDVILELLSQPGMNFSDLPAALKERKIFASAKIVRTVRERLNQRKNIRRDHKERMIGIYRKWKKKSRDVVIQYKGRTQPYAKLRRTITYREKKHRLDEQDLNRLERYSGPTPKEIYYFDPSDRNTNLLEADGCDWDPSGKDEALRYISGNPTEEPRQIDLQIRMSPASSATRLADEQDLIRPEGYSRPTPKEIYPFDLSDPHTNLLESGGCDWGPSEKDEVLRYLVGNPTEEPHQIDLQIQMSTASSPPRPAASTMDLPDYQDEPIDSILSTPDRVPNSIWNWVRMPSDHTNLLSGDESHYFRTLMLDLYAKLYGSTQYDPHRMTTLSDQFLDRGMLDEADKVASTAVILTRRFYGPTDAQSILAVVNLAKVRTQQGSYQEAYRIGVAAVESLKNVRADYDEDVLQSKCRLCETLLELGQLDLAKKLCYDVLWRSSLDLNVDHEIFVSFRFQLARICNAQEEYLEAKEILEHLIRDFDNRFGMSDERTLRASIEFVHSLCGLGDWEAVTRSSQLERQIKRRETIGIPREMWTVELVHSVGVQLYNLGAYFQAGKVFHNYFQCLRGIIQLPRHSKLINAECWIANSLYYQGKNKEAGTIYARLLTAAEDTWGPYHRRTLVLMSNLAWATEEEAVFTVFESRMFKVRDLRIKHLGKDDLDTLDSQRYCAYVRTIRGEWDESLATLQNLHDVQKKKSDSKGRSRITNLESLLVISRILSRRRQDSKAESLLRQALDLGERLFGRNHPRALVALTPLAFSLARLGRYSEAEKLLSEGISTLTGSLGKQHHQVMEMELTHADILSFQDKYADAAKIQSCVLQEYTKTYGIHHPYVIHVTGSLASSYAEQDMAVEAQKLFEIAIKSCQSTFGPEHQQRCNLELSLAKMLREQRNLKKALSLSQTILKVARASFGTIAAKSGDSISYLEHPGSLPVLEALALTYTRLGDITQSAELLKKNLAIRTKLQGQNHPDTITSLTLLASVYINAEEYLTAEHLYRDAIGRSIATFGDWHAQTIVATVGHGRALRGLERYTESIATFYKMLNLIFNNQGGECHSGVAEIYRDIAILYSLQDRFEESVRFLKLALRVYKKLKHKSVVNIMINLCACYIRMDAYSKAEAQAEEAVHEAEKIFGPGHPETINAQMTQASALIKNKKYIKVDELTKGLRHVIEKHEGKDSTRLLHVEHIYGRSLCAQGRMKEAEAFLESCINLRPSKDPRDPELCGLIRLYGVVKEELGEPSATEAVLQNLLIRLEPQNSLDSLKGSSDHQLTTYTEIMEELAQAKVSLHKYESAEALMKKVLNLRKEFWGEGSQQACDAERNLAKCIPEDRLLDRLRLQENIYHKYWVVKGLDMESSIPLLLNMADTCSSLRDFKYEVTIRERILDIKPYPSDRDQQYVWDVQKLSLACHELGQFEKAERLLEVLEELIRDRFPANLRDLAWTLQLLSRVKTSLGKLEAAASTLERSLLAGTQNPTEKVGDNLERLDDLVDLNVKLCRWQEAKEAWITLMKLREEAQTLDWILPSNHWERLELIDEKLGSTEPLDDGEPS